MLNTKNVDVEKRIKFRKTTGLKNILAVARVGCDDDLLAVAALPSQWIPRRCGATLDNYFTDMEVNHKKVFEDILDKAAQINKKIDDKVRSISESLASYIQEKNRSVNCVVESNVCNKNFNDRALENAIKKVRELHDKLIEYLVNFKQEAQCLERERGDGIRKLLREQFQRLIDLGHQKPNDLLKEFDKRIYEVNQQLLSNSRAYNDLEAQIHCQADEDLIRARSKLNEILLEVVAVQHRPSSLHSRKQQKDSLSVGHKHDSSAEILLSDMRESFEKCVARSVEVYRAAVVKVYAGFFDKFNSLQTSLDCRGFVSPISSANDLIELQEMIQKAIANFMNVALCKVEADQQLLDSARCDTICMQQSLKSLGERLRITYSILHDAGHLWDPHLLRLALARKLSVTSVEDMIANHDVIELANEVRFNIVLEQLRTCPDFEQLESLLNQLETMLGGIAATYFQHSQAEIERLNEFMNLPRLMSQLLLAEFNCFLKKYPKRAHKVPGATTSQPGTPDEIRERRGSCKMPKSVLQTALQETALKNWQAGFLESIQSNIACVPDELLRQSKFWVDEKSVSLSFRYSMKMASHNIRLERVRAARDARFAELQYHEDRLQSHLNALKIFTEQVIVQALEMLSLESPQLYPIVYWIHDLEDKINKLNEETDTPELDKEVRRMKKLSYVARIARHRQLFVDSLEEFLENHRAQVQQCFQTARISNVRFLQEIKLFSQDGRYAAAEALRCSTAIVNAAEFLETSMNKFTEALSQRRLQLLAAVEELVDPVQRVIGDTVKPLAKSCTKRFEKERKIKAKKSL